MYPCRRRLGRSGGLGQAATWAFILVGVAALVGAVGNFAVSLEVASRRSEIKGSDDRVKNAQGANKDYDLSACEKNYKEVIAYAQGLKPPLVWLPAARKAQVLVPLAAYSLLRVCLIQGRGKDAKGYCELYLKSAPNGKHAAQVQDVAALLDQVLAGNPQGGLIFDLDQAGQTTVQR